MTTYYAEDDSSFELKGFCDYAFNRVNTWQQRQQQPTPEEVASSSFLGDSGDNTGSGFSLSWANRLVTKADYNRSLDHNTYYVDEGNAGNHFAVATSAQGACFDRYICRND